MGEVYRATDSNLKRQVAIKVLRQTVAADPDRLARSATAHELLFVTFSQSKVMFAPYDVVGDSFRAEKPQMWSPTSILGARTRQ